MPTSATQPNLFQTKTLESETSRKKKLSGRRKTVSFWEAQKGASGGGAEFSAALPSMCKAQDETPPQGGEQTVNSV